MKRVVSVYLNGSNIQIYEQKDGDDYTYLVFYIGKNHKRTYLDYFDCVSEATEFALITAMCNG